MFDSLHGRTIQTPVRSPDITDRSSGIQSLRLRNKYPDYLDFCLEYSLCSNLDLSKVSKCRVSKSIISKSRVSRAEVSISVIWLCLGFGISIGLTFLIETNSRISIMGVSKA